MSYQTIASGGKTDFYNIVQYDDSFEEGDRGILRMNFTTAISDSILSSIENELINRGVQEARVTRSRNTVDIHFRKAIPALVVILAVITALILTLAVILISWKIFREVVPSGLQGTVGTGLIVVGIAAVGIIAIKRLRG